jgi:hypothetical protein
MMLCLEDTRPFTILVDEDEDVPRLEKPGISGNPLYDFSLSFSTVIVIVNV